MLLLISPPSWDFLYRVSDAKTLTGVEGAQAEELSIFEDG
jgi:hypothetical protein